MRNRFLWIPLALALGLPIGSGAKETKPAEATLRAKLLPRYEAARIDAKLQALDRIAQANPNEREAVERVLQASPLSPRDYFELDQEIRHYEIFLPRVLDEWHLRWVELHEKDARDLYGDAEVDRLVGAGPQLEADAPGAPALPAGSAGPNRNVAATQFPPPDEYDGEIQIAVNPANPKQVVAASNSKRNGPALCDFQDTQAIFWSSDNGATWNHTCAPPIARYGLTGCGAPFGSDPALAWSTSGEVFLNYMLVCLPSPFADPTSTLAVARSLDGGATWTAHGLVTPAFWLKALDDKNFYAIDTNPGSPFFGRHYACWDRNNDERFAFSTNGGVGWTESDIPSIAPGNNLIKDLGCELAVQKNGTVHVVWTSLQCGGGLCFDQWMLHTRSTDGGVTWSPPVFVKTFNLVEFSGGDLPLAAHRRGITPWGAIDVDNSGGACDGTLYVTFGDFPSGTNVNSTDVWLTRSLDQGATWSAPIKVNDDNLAGRVQFHPWLVVDQSLGAPVLAWHDARNDSGNRRVEIWAGRSLDCGLSFEPNLRVSQPSAEFNNNTIAYVDESANNVNANANQYGEYLGLDVRDGQAYVAWVDSRHFFPGSAANAQRENLGFASVNFYKTRVFGPVSYENGWMLESSETSNLGGSSGSGLMVGDGKNDSQFKGMASFDTAGIRDGATVVAATLRLQRSGGVGTSPFTTHGALRVHMSSAFGGSTTLVPSDFEAPPTSGLLVACTLSAANNNGDWSECAVGASSLGLVNKLGHTQFRLFFSLGDNDDLGADLVEFHDGSSFERTTWPQLVVTWQ